jgi:profilin
LSPAEIQEVITGLSGKPEKLFADGLHVAGERYVLTKAEDRSLYARKVGLFSYRLFAFHLDGLER